MPIPEKGASQMSRIETHRGAVRTGRRRRLALALVVALAATISVAALSAAAKAKSTRVYAKPGAGVVIGYAGLSSQFPFVADVNMGLSAAAKKAGAKLIILDNKFDPQVALTNADLLIQRHANVIIEFQTDVSVAPALCQKFAKAGLAKKVIAIDIPQPPCAKFFGANNPLAGQIAGQRLAQLAKTKWGSVDKVVLLALPQSGALVVSRTDGYVTGVRTVFPSLADSDVIKVNGGGSVDGCLAAMNNVLAQVASAQHILVGGVNDPCILGAERAVQAAGRSAAFLMAGQNATIEARAEICNNSSVFVGSVAYFPERYGARLVDLAIKLYKGKKIPAFNYINHVWIDNSNIRKYYPHC